MKKSMYFAGLLSVVVALVLAAPAVAQQNSYTIHVPFQFRVDARVLPAGDYRIGIAAPGTVQIRGIDHSANATFVAPGLNRSSHEAQNAELRFHRYGRQYFLSQVWFSNGDTGYELYVTNTEREFAEKVPNTEMVLRAAK